MRSNTFGLLLAGMAAAFWPVWVWFAAGSMDASNDYTGLLAAASAILLAGSTRVEQRIAYPLLLPTALTAAYAIATAAGVSMSLRAMLAFLALAALASACRMGKRFDLTLAALSMLALPLAASLQFYFGYPLRVLAGALSATLLQLNGIAANLGACARAGRLQVHSMQARIDLGESERIVEQLLAIDRMEVRLAPLDHAAEAADDLPGTQRL